MSVIIIGGHDRMVRQYKEICQNHKYKAKVFTQMKTGLDKQIGCPDLLILFTGTVSRKMIRCVLDNVDKQKTSVVRCHTSGRNALEDILKNIVPDDIVRPGEGEGLKEGLDEFLSDKAVLSGGTSFAFLFLRFNLFD